MPERKNRGRELRALFATLAVICLLGAGVSYGATRYLQSELEADATRDARKLSTDVLQPLLLPRDATAPVRGARYDELLTSVRERVLAGPITEVLLWGQDGTVLFSNDRGLVGERHAKMRDDVHASIAGSSRSTVQGERFHTLTSIKVGQPPTLVTAELVRSHSAIVEESREQWYPWVGRALTAAAVLAALSVLTAIVFAVAGAWRTRRARRPRVAETDAPAARAGRPADTDAPAATDGSVPTSTRAGRPAETDASVPAYMRPGFREEVEARRRMEGMAAE